MDDLNEILQYIPSGAQTLSKYPTQYAVGVTPPNLVKGKGPYLWDANGKQYLDLVLALGPMILGYANERIDNIVKKQIDLGTVFTLPAACELKLAKLLREVVPCAEMSRFLLNGNDATSGAIRLSRYITKRDHVVKCGYHGCQDWSVSTNKDRNTGVPAVIATMTHDFIYNDIESLKKIFSDYPGKIAVVIMEPVSSEAPRDNFLEEVKKVAHDNGALLVFDEMVTGFRWSLGGAQEYFKVVPDLACFGKAISNGFPISVLCGKAEYMRSMNEVFISTTYGGFTLGVVAAIETIKYLRENVYVFTHLHQMGERLIKGGNEVFLKYNLPFKFIGYGPHPLFTVSKLDDYNSRVVKTYIYQEMNKAGILFSTSILIGYLHTAEHMDQVINKLDEICAMIFEAKGDYKQIEAKLVGPVMAPRTVRLAQ